MTGPGDEDDRSDTAVSPAGDADEGETLSAVADDSREQSGVDERPGGNGDRERLSDPQPSAEPDHDRRPVGRQSPDPPPGPPHRHGGDTDDGPADWQLFVWDVVSSVLAVVLFGLYLFAISGVWPPLVAVESGSMEPNMNTHDLVFVMDSDRFPAAEATGGTGVVTAERGAQTGYTEFGGHGDVIIFAPDGRAGETPIIHRAMLWVEEGENWYNRADPAYVENADSCVQLRSCPAPHDGYVTKGDNNGAYDQTRGLSAPVKPEWVVGTAELRAPGIGWLRLQFQ
ncbi:MAG: S26 family signal peptidase [Halovenus sp.]